MLKMGHLKADFPGSTTRNGDLRCCEELHAIRGELERRILGLIHGIERNTRPKYILRTVVETDIGTVKVPR